MKSSNLLKTENSAISKIKSVLCSKSFIVFCIVLLASVTPMFAESSETIDTLDSWGTKILDLLSGTWVKVILLVALIIEAIGMVIAGQQGGGGAMVKKFLPWIIGTIVLLSASGIVSYFASNLHFEVSFLIPSVSTAALV